MTTRIGTSHVFIEKVSSAGREEREDVLASEEPLEIRLAYFKGKEVLQKSLAVTMRTPGNDVDFPTGWSRHGATLSSLYNVTLNCWLAVLIFLHLYFVFLMYLSALACRYWHCILHQTAADQIITIGCEFAFVHLLYTWHTMTYTAPLRCTKTVCNLEINATPQFSVLH